MKIAIVGSGVSGLTALWALNRYSDHEVELYEKEDRLGGDACTIDLKVSEDSHYAVDLAFLLFNERGWPNFWRMLQQLQVPVEEATPTLSFSGEGRNGIFEWSSHSLWTLFGTWRNLLSLDVWSMVFDIVRFNYLSLDILRNAQAYDGLTLEDCLSLERYGNPFRYYYLLPFLASIWSISLSEAASIPVAVVVQNLHNIAGLQLFSKPPWHAVKHGSREYVNAVISTAPKGTVHVQMGVERITKEKAGMLLQFSDGSRRSFDHIILATHTGTTAHLLQDGDMMSPELAGALADTTWTDIELVAHSDTNLMPRLKQNWAGWNNLVTGSHIQPITGMEKPDEKHAHAPRGVSCTFSLNHILASLPQKGVDSMLVSYNPHLIIHPMKIFHRQKFSQPVPTVSHFASQKKLNDRIWSEQYIPKEISIIGAWTGYGFHEDGVVAALEAVSRLSVNVPPLLPRNTAVAQLGASEWFLRGMIGFLHGLSGWIGIT